MAEMEMTPCINGAEADIERYDGNPIHGNFLGLLAPCTMQYVAEILEWGVLLQLMDAACGLIRRVEHAASVKNGQDDPDVIRAVSTIQPLLPAIESLYQGLPTLSPNTELSPEDFQMWHAGKGFLINRCFWARRIFGSFFASCGY